MALHCAVEFALTYCREGIIDTTVNFVGMNPSGQYLISFDIIFNRNKLFNEEPLVRMLSELSTLCKNDSQNYKMRTEELLLQNYVGFFGLIQNFGMGMIILPNLI